MKYINELRNQAKLFTIYFLSCAITYTVAMYFGYVAKPIILDINHMSVILGFSLTFIFINPLLFTCIDV